MIFMAGGNAYKLVYNHKNGWNPEAFRERYSEVLDRYDFIVGDWGYNQLRLKGFYRDDHPKAAKDTAISGLMDYLNEYCNFGCAYFVLAKTDRKQLPPDEPVVTIEPPKIGDGSGGAAGEDGSSGVLMRWPPKERAGGPVRVPYVSAYDLARAAAEMEKRREAAEAASGGQRHASGRGQSGNGARRAGERRPVEAGEKAAAASGAAASGAGAGGAVPGGGARNGAAAAGGAVQYGASQATGMAHGTAQGSGAPQAGGAASGSFKPGRARGRSKSKAKRTPHAQQPDRPRETPRDAGGTGSSGGSGGIPRDGPAREAGAEPHERIRVSGIQQSRQQETPSSAKERPAGHRGGHWGPNRRRGRFHGKPDRQPSGQPPRSEG